MSIKFTTFGLEKSLGYVTEAALEVFSPNHDSYPSIGVQPFRTYATGTFFCRVLVHRLIINLVIRR